MPIPWLIEGVICHHQQDSGLVSGEIILILRRKRTSHTCMYIVFAFSRRGKSSYGNYELDRLCDMSTMDQ